MKTNISRRDFMEMGITAGTMMVFCRAPELFASEGVSIKPGPDVWVIRGDDKVKLMERCLHIIEANGGFGENIETLALKVNAAWARTPEQGANTHPVLVDTFITGCNASGIKKIVVPEHPCNRASQSFTRSGILDITKKHGVNMIDLKTDQGSFTSVSIPGGKRLRDAEVAAEFLEADAIVNMPVAKHHGGAMLSLGMKNWMGAVKDRHYWHRNNLHQCIADFSSFMRPTWTIIDATRTMMDHGPQGPADELRTPNALIVSRDPIAADAYAATLFHDQVDTVPYLRIAREMGLGVTDPAAMKIHEIVL